MDISLPVDKLKVVSSSLDVSSTHVAKGKRYAVLVATGSFNPPTFMHLRMFELARDALNSEGYHVIGAYLSPVNDAYGKMGLIGAEHRIQMCQLACKGSDFVMVDPWEGKQTTYQRTLTVLSRVKSSLCDEGLVSEGNFASVSVSGNTIGIDDLLESCLFVVLRENKVHQVSSTLQSLLNTLEVRSNIMIVDELIPNQISSTRIRDCISRGLSVMYLTPDEVMEYIQTPSLCTPTR